MTNLVVLTINQGGGWVRYTAMRAGDAEQVRRDPAMQGHVPASAILDVGPHGEREWGDRPSRAGRAAIEARLEDELEEDRERESADADREAYEDAQEWNERRDREDAAAHAPETRSPPLSEVQAALASLRLAGVIRDRDDDPVRHFTVQQVKEARRGWF